MEGGPSTIVHLLNKKQSMTYNLTQSHWKTSVDSNIKGGERDGWGKTALKNALLAVSNRTKLAQTVAITLNIARAHSAPPQSGPIPIL